MIKDIIEIRKLDAKEGNTVRTLQFRGILTRYVNAKGYACFDRFELERYRRNVKMGRPVKMKYKNK
jgi:hypothetical protein